MPIFFLYFNAHVPLHEVLWLEAIYYCTIVLVEVPSGYISDRFGRKRTLVTSSVLLVASYLCFATAHGFPSLAIAQILLAMGFAAGSGTDTSFHLDSLMACERDDELGDREARITTISLLSGASAAAAGGALAMVVSMRWVYALSALTTLLTVVIAWRFVEPPVQTPDEASERFVSQVVACVRLAMTPPLRWLLGCAVFAIVLNHIPYEFYQPYLGHVAALSTVDTPLIAGIHMAVAAMVASVFGAQSVNWSRRMGLHRLMLLSVISQWLLILWMGLWLHPVIALLLVARGIPGALQQAPLNEAIAPRIPAHQRATMLSLKSLAGRLGFAGLLLTVSALPTSAPGVAPGAEVQALVSWAALLTSLGLIALMMGWRNAQQ